MASPAAKAKMRISAAGNKAQSEPPPSGRTRGFTLIELLVVISIIAIASAGVVFAMRDSAQTQTEREAQRLAALLESARAQSRTRGVAVVWRSTGQGFVFDGLPPNTLPDSWLEPTTRVPPGSRLELGPDPIIAAQSVTLSNRQQSSVSWRVATDGLRPFSLQTSNTAEAAGAGAQP
jgi:general secretion pathway protein H